MKSLTFAASLGALAAGTGLGNKQIVKIFTKIQDRGLFSLARCFFLDIDFNKKNYFPGWTSNLQSKILAGDYGFKVESYGESMKCQNAVKFDSKP